MANPLITGAAGETQSMPCNSSEAECCHTPSKVCFASRKVTVMSSADQTPQSDNSRQASGIMKGRDFVCEEYTGETSTRYSLLARNRTKLDSYPAEIVSEDSEASSETIEQTKQLFQENQERLDSYDYRLVLDKDLIAQKKARELKSAKEQQKQQTALREQFQREEESAQELDREAFYYATFQEYLNEYEQISQTDPFPDLIEQPDIKNLPCSFPAAVATCLGGKDYQEDRHCLQTVVLPNNQRESFCCVFDGHGGSASADFVQRVLGPQVVSRIHQFSEDQCEDVAVFNAMKVGCVDAARQAKNTVEIGGGYCIEGSGYSSGTTACGVLTYKDRLHFFNCGDSRAIRIDRHGQITQMTEDAKASNPRYQSSVKKRLGEIIYEEGDDYRVAGKFITPRGLGDGKFAGMNARPKITEAENEAGQIIILATDGVFDLATTDQIGALAYRLRQQGRNEQEIAGIIASLCLRTIAKISQVSGLSLKLSGDNITVMVLFPKGS